MQKGDAMKDSDTLAARLARADAGDAFFNATTPTFQRHLIARWEDTLETIRRAGLEVVEADDGR